MSREKLIENFFKYVVTDSNHDVKCYERCREEVEKLCKEFQERVKLAHPDHSDLRPPPPTTGAAMPSSGSKEHGYAPGQPAHKQTPNPNPNPNPNSTVSLGTRKEGEDRGARTSLASTLQLDGIQERIQQNQLQQEQFREELQEIQVKLQQLQDQQFHLQAEQYARTESGMKESNDEDKDLSMAFSWTAIPLEEDDDDSWPVKMPFSPEPDLKETEKSLPQAPYYHHYKPPPSASTPMAPPSWKTPSTQLTKDDYFWPAKVPFPFPPQLEEEFDDELRQDMLNAAFQKSSSQAPSYYNKPPAPAPAPAPSAQDIPPIPASSSPYRFGNSLAGGRDKYLGVSRTKTGAGTGTGTAHGTAGRVFFERARIRGEIAADREKYKQKDEYLDPVLGRIDDLPESYGDGFWSPMSMISCSSARWPLGFVPIVDSDKDKDSKGSSNIDKGKDDNNKGKSKGEDNKDHMKDDKDKNKDKC